MLYISEVPIVSVPKHPIGKVNGGVEAESYVFFISVPAGGKCSASRSSSFNSVVLELSTD